MVNQNNVTNLKTVGPPWATSLVQFTFTNVSEGSFWLVSQRLLVFQPRPNGPLEVVRKGGIEEPNRPSIMQQFVGGETCRLAPL